MAGLDGIDLSGLPQPTTAKALRYWFDGDTDNMQSVSGTSGIYTLDVSSLEDGIHTLHYVVIDDRDMLSSTCSTVFLKSIPTVETPVATTASKLRYWFDGDTDNMQSVSGTSGIYTLDVSSLEDGIHTLHYVVIDDRDMLSSTCSTVFLKSIPTVETPVATTASKLRYWFDGDTDNMQSVSGTTGIYSLDVSSLEDGLHTIYYQITDNKDQLSSPVSSTFLKFDFPVAIDNKPVQVKNMRYWLDGNMSTMKTSDLANGIQVIDVSAVEPGIHTLYYQLVDENGSVSSPVSSVFLKYFDKSEDSEENLITRYGYWVNSNTDSFRYVTLDNPTNSYKLIDLLTVPKEMIRSAFFHFEVTDGKPMIYAKNVFHVRFHDAAGYFADSDKPFVDYSVSQQVVPVGELQHTQTFARVAGNAIQWYSLNVERGDTVAFKTSQACSVQLFSPSGEEVYSASGSTSVSFGGCHTWEDGTYYLAIHDVTGSKSQMSLDYMHMEKYDVVRQDVSVVGNGGCSTITFDGNGFKDLYAVELTDGNGHTIEHVYIGHESDATTSVTFDFTDAALGKYDAIFRFADEDKVFKNIVTVEEARDIELATTVTYPSTFLRGTSTTYTISITNNGNMTAYNVPLDIYLTTSSTDNIKRVKHSGKLSGNDATHKETVDYSSDDEEVDAEIHEIIDEYFQDVGDNDMSQYIFLIDSIQNLAIGIAQYLINIPPSSTATLNVEIQSNSAVSLKAEIIDEWIPFAATKKTLTTQKEKTLHEKVSSFMCCNREKIECVADAINSFVPVGISCGSSVVLSGIETVYDILCSDGNGLHNKWNEYLKNGGGWTILKRISGSVISCGAGYYGKRIEELNNKRKLALESGDVTGDYSLALKYSQDIVKEKKEFSGWLKVGKGILFAPVGYDCFKSLFRQGKKCSPDLKDRGGTSTPVAPADPNEILGYSAESGSLAVKDGLRDVYYTIQFENDTTFATASAHDIYLTDTLDTKKFDLSTFAPTRVKIGSKSAELTGEPNSVTTVDMRPEINAIAQVESSVDQKKGIVSFHISSLDPMTMEPTKYLMDGVLPVNYDGSGLGEVSFDIQLRDGLKNGTEIPNRAGIVFDNNDVIMTPTWTNIVDRIPPVSRAESASYVNDSTVAVSINASDNLSGPWRYDVYVQYDSGAWFLAAENVPMDSAAHVRTYKGITHRLYTVCTDEAGNVERKQQKSELSIQVGGGVVTAVDTLPEKEGEEETESGDVYDLQGRKSNEAQAGKGIIIKNRKKVAKF